jgi:pyrroloquinoline-quinone synthase
VEHTVTERIEQARSRCNVLEHPFYRRWSAGELSADELARYSGQYRHAVEAVATASAQLAEGLPERPELREHAHEESEHVALWDGFVAAVGGSPGAAATAETAACAAEWTRADGVVETLARLYAVESGQPEISATKLAGLSDHYGVTDEAGTAYFTLHRSRDVEHAAEGRELLEELLAADPAAADRAVAAAEGAFRANWELLDGVA